MTNVVESSSASQIISYNHTPLPTIKVPFPPEVNAQDLITLRESPDGTKKLSTRAPNAFIIYRKQFVKTARDEGHFLPMTVISSMASTAWENEKEEVRAEYKRIAKEAHIKRKAMYPKTNNRRKRKEKWNLVSFQPVNSVNKPVSQEILTTITTNTENITTTEIENTATANTENIKNENLTPEALAKLTSILTNSFFPSNLDENYFAQYYPSPSYVSYNESPDLSYTSYNESPNPSYSDSSSNSTSPNLDSNINSNLNINLYDSTEQYPSPYLISISDDNIQGYNSINDVNQSNFYGDDWNLNLENGIVSSIPLNSTSNESATSIANTTTPLITSSSNTPRLDSSDFITINNTTPILTQNNYEIIDFPTNYNDAIIYNNDVISYNDAMIQPLIMMQ